MQWLLVDEGRGRPKGLREIKGQGKIGGHDKYFYYLDNLMGV